MSNEEENNKPQKPVTVLQGDGYYFDRLLLRDSSVGNSSRIYYPSTTEGVPFQWEMQPGTPKHPPENDIIPPLTPPPAVQSLGLPPRPNCVDQITENSNHKWKAWFWKKSKKKLLCSHESKRSVTDKFGGLEEFNSDYSSSSASSSSSSSLNCASLNSREKDSRLEGPFVCSPWNITAILSEGNTNNTSHYCSTQKAVPRNCSAGDSYSSRMYYRSTEGVPFQWEMHPGKSKDPMEGNEVIPPPSPPPAVLSQGLPNPCVMIHNQPNVGSKAPMLCFWNKSIKKIQQHKEAHKTISCLSRSFKVTTLHKSSASTLSSSSSSSSSSSDSPWTVKAILGRVRRPV